MGGAVFNHFGILTIVDSTLTANTAVGGAGIHSDSKGLGGAIFNLNGTVSVTNSTLARNTAADGGGALYNLGYESAFASVANVTLVNSILAASTSGADLVIDDPANTTAGANAASATVTATAPNLVSRSALGAGALDRLAVDRQPQPWPPPVQRRTGHADAPPNAGSPAIDAGQATGCPSVDQRGRRPPAGGGLRSGGGGGRHHARPPCPSTRPAGRATPPQPSIAFTATFSEAVLGFTAADVALPARPRLGTLSAGRHRRAPTTPLP